MNKEQLLKARLASLRAIPGTKIIQKANLGLCTLTGSQSIQSQALRSYFYNKRFKSGKFISKVM